MHILVRYEYIEATRTSVYLPPHLDPRPLSKQYTVI